MKKLFMAAAIAAVFCMSSAAQASISVLDNEGSIYNVDTLTGAASLVVDYPDTAGTDASSPNGLGVTGVNAYYTTHNQSGNEDIYLNGAIIDDVAVSTGSIASGDAIGDNFYFVTSNANMGTFVGGVYQGLAAIGSVPGSGSLEFGDLALVNDTFGYMSFSRGSSHYFASLSYDGTDWSVDDWRLTAGQSKFLGLGFDGDDLYGVIGSTLYSVDLTVGATFGAGSGAQTITLGLGGPTLTGLTDASRAVVPEATTILIWSILGLIGFNATRRVR